MPLQLKFSLILQLLLLSLYSRSLKGHTHYSKKERDYTIP